MNDPWEPDYAVEIDEARALIGRQFPQFANVDIVRFGQGWDNVAYLVDEHYIFRFPQRKMGGELIEREITFMPSIAPHVPLPTTAPQFVGAAADGYPWRFAGYAKLRGATACSRTLLSVERGQLAEDLACFLRALHDFDISTLPQPLPSDTLGKLDPHHLQIDEAPLSGKHCLVHGDLYARHLLLDRKNELCGVIDWGDLHEGNPAVDLAVVHQMIPRRMHSRFLDIYGPVDERTWRFARHRARFHALACEKYAAGTNDADLLQAAHTALRYIDEQ